MKTTEEKTSEAESLAFSLARVRPDDCGNEAACARAAEMIRRLLSMHDETADHIEALTAERDALAKRLEEAEAESARLRMILKARYAWAAGEPSQPPQTGLEPRPLIATPDTDAEPQIESHSISQESNGVLQNAPGAPELAAMVEAGKFLADRLGEFELTDDADEMARHYLGHVEPAETRFRASLAALEGE